MRKIFNLNIVAILIIFTAVAGQSTRPRLRELGFEPGTLPTGPLNAITDVAGVKVGHSTLIEGKNIRTGVTAIIPHEGNVFQNKVQGAVYVGNGFGKAAGFLQVQELGLIETPIILTNTLAVGTAIDAVVRWTLKQPKNGQVRSVNAIVGETNDGYLNDIRGMHITKEDVWAAIDVATGGPVAEGNVGAGTGTRALGYKGGIGTASRVVSAHEVYGDLTVGALVQSNYGGQLTIMGRTIGKKRTFGSAGEIEQEFGSVMIVLATDAPLDARDLERMAKRALLGIARTGSYMSNGSGDFVIAFSTGNKVSHETNTAFHEATYLRSDQISALFLATVEAVEEAVYNSLLAATTVPVGRRFGRSANTQLEAVPLDLVRRMLQD